MTDTGAGESYRVLIADDHPVVCRGIRRILESGSDFEVCGEASSGDEALSHIENTKPDVVVLDLTMPIRGGWEIIREIRRIAPSTKILVLTMHESGVLARQAVQAGAHGYLLKSDAEPELLTAIHTLRQDKCYISPRLAEEYEDALESCDRLSELSGSGVLGMRLTVREVEIITLLAQGKSNKESAASLGISRRTVESHRAQIMQKMNFTSLSDLIRFAVRNRLVER